MCETAFDVRVGPPREFTDQQIADFEALVLSESRVAKETLSDLVRDAPRLAVILFDEEIVGCAAIKKPIDSYRTRVFKNSGLEDNLNDFPLELGWVVVKPAHRRKGLASRLVQALFQDQEIIGVYATSQARDANMHTTLTKFGFKKLGVPYDSKEEAGEKISVFLKK
jgi:GNAT superfamily N-acetyltransferase